MVNQDSLYNVQRVLFDQWKQVVLVPGSVLNNQNMYSTTYTLKTFLTLPACRHKVITFFIDLLTFWLFLSVLLNKRVKLRINVGVFRGNSGNCNCKESIMRVMVVQQLIWQNWWKKITQFGKTLSILVQRRWIISYRCAGESRKISFKSQNKVNFFETALIPNFFCYFGNQIVHFQI